MACDEALASLIGGPVLRTYRWNTPALSFGYSQRIKDVLRLANGRPAVRRWTGGGTVFHGNDLTLALWIPIGEEIALQNSTVIYRSIHEALLPAIQAVFPNAGLVSPEDCRCGPVCFESPAAYDVVLDSRKILGGAMRRSRQGVLYQGSLHARLGPSALANALGDSVEIMENNASIEKNAARLALERYSFPAWLNLR